MGNFYLIQLVYFLDHLPIMTGRIGQKYLNEKLKFANIQIE